MPLFLLHNVSYKNIVAYPNIEIPTEQVTFICGKSGGGKSTLLKLLNGVLSCDSGILQYNGKNIGEYDPIGLRQEILLSGQSVYLFDTTIEGNFREYHAYRGLTVPSEQTMLACMAACTIALPLETECTTMSGGERQRVFIAVCLSFMPKVLLLDEPTSALDEQTAAMFFESILRFCRQHSMTPIVVSHQRTLAEQYGQHIIHLEGR